MANRLSVNPWVIDTAGAAILYVTDVEVEHFEFFNYALDTDNVVVQDRLGNIVWQENGASDLRAVRSGKIGRINGLAVPTLTAGARLAVYIK